MLTSLSLEFQQNLVLLNSQYPLGEPLTKYDQIRFVDNKHDNIKNKPFAEETFYLNPYEINELFVAREITLRYPGVRVSAK